MVTTWAISMMCIHNLSSFHCIVKPPFSCQIPMVSATQWMTKTTAFSAERRTHTVSILNFLAFGTTDFGNQQASDCIWCSQRWSIIEWWISHTWCSKPALGVMNRLSRVIWCNSGGEWGMSKDLVIVSTVHSQVKSRCGLGGVTRIWWYHLGWDSARNQSD